MRATTEEDIASEITRETRNSAISNDFGPLSSVSGSSQGRFERAISTDKGPFESKSGEMSSSLVVDKKVEQHVAADK